MLKQFKFEVIKLAKSKMVALSFITVVAFVVLMLWGFYSYAERKMGAEATAQFKYTYESRSYFNGLTFALYSLIFSFSLLIPILGIVVDSPIGRALARRLEGPQETPPDVAALAKRVELLEAEVDDLNRSVQTLQDEATFLQRLLADPSSRSTLPPPPGS